MPLLTSHAITRTMDAISEESHAIMQTLHYVGKQKVLCRVSLNTYQLKEVMKVYSSVSVVSYDGNFSKAIARILLHFSRTRYDKCIWFIYRSFPLSDRFNYHQSYHPVFVLKVAEIKTQNKPLPQLCFNIQWIFLLSRIDWCKIDFNRTSKFWKNRPVKSMIYEGSLVFKEMYTYARKAVGRGQAIWHTFFLIWKFWASVFPRVWNLTINTRLVNQST